MRTREPIKTVRGKLRGHKSISISESKA